MKKINLLLSLFLAGSAFSQSWELIIPSSSFDGTKLGLSNSAYDRVNNKVYSLHWNNSAQLIQEFDLNTENVAQLSATNGPGELYSFTYDFENAQLIAGRVGRDQLYTLSTSGGAWAAGGAGGFDSESYGTQYYYNPTDNSVGYFGGYGFYQVKNWVWQNDGVQWTEILTNDVNCDNFTPPKRVNGNPILGNPSENAVYYFSGAGNCSGSQLDQSCPLGSPWASDVGIWCWLKDIWKYDIENNSFTQILPVNHSSVTLEGDVAYDYINNTFYLIGGYIPSAVYNPTANPNFEKTVFRYRVGIDTGFIPLQVSGTAPAVQPVSSTGAHSAYFDAQNDRIIWLRFDGVYSLNLDNVGLNSKDMNPIKLYPNPNQGEFSIEVPAEIMGMPYEIQDIHGRILKTGEIQSTTQTINLGEIASGNYWLKVENQRPMQLVKN